MRVRCGAGCGNGCRCGSRAGKILPARPSGIFVGWVQNMKIKNKISNIVLKLTEQLNKTVKWMKVYLNKSSFNFVRLIFRSQHNSRSQRFRESWLQSVRRLSALSAVIAAILFATTNPIRLNDRSQLAEEDKMEKTNIAMLTRNDGKVSHASRSFQKHRGSSSYFLFLFIFIFFSLFFREELSTS